MFNVPALPIEEAKKVNLGPLAQEYLSVRGDDYDKTFGLKYDQSSKKYLIGKFVIDFDQDDLIINNERKIIGTRGLWELIMTKYPNEDHITQSDRYTYWDLVFQSLVFRDENTQRPKSSKGYK